MKDLLVTIIQSDLHWQNKAANIAMFTQKIESINEPTQLIVLPEMFTTGFTMQAATLAEPMDGITVQWMQQMASQKNAVVCGSVIITENSNYYNRFIWMQPNGSYSFYDKRHLFGYAGEDAHFTSGNKRLVTELKDAKFNCNICYDLRFPVWVRQSNQAQEQYDVLVYVANWPIKRSNAWKTLLQARAIENQCFVIGVNRVGEDGNGYLYNGDSMIINPLGEILYHKEKEEDVSTIAMPLQQVSDIRTQIPFLKDGDDFRIVD
jgi:omega-amidase